MEHVALFGAAGKMGTRISETLRGAPEYSVMHVEAGVAGLARLRERGLEPVAAETAAAHADIVVLAVPDVVIGRVSHQIVPRMRPGAMLVCLDPAAPYAGELPERDDVTYFVTHPCHPPIVNDEVEPEARHDYFGGVARQSVVCALMQGPEADYVRGEALCRRMFRPILRVHRVTVEQMALLEPALAETTVLTLMAAIREALDETIARGVPADAAWDFLLGHMHVNLGILFGFLDAEVSDGAKLAMARAREILLQPDWKKVFEPEYVMREVKAITEGIRR